MEEFGQAVVYPTLGQIVALNKHLLDRYGGEFFGESNLRYEGPLLYMLDAISGAIFGTDLYPSLKEKAAALAHSIIGEHVFWDGNKRTGVYAAWLFLAANRVEVYLDHSVEDLAVRIADQTAGFQDMLSWLHSHQWITDPG